MVVAIRMWVLQTWNSYAPCLIAIIKYKSTITPLIRGRVTKPNRFRNFSSIVSLLLPLLNHSETLNTMIMKNGIKMMNRTMKQLKMMQKLIRITQTLSHLKTTRIFSLHKRSSPLSNPCSSRRRHLLSAIPHFLLPKPDSKMALEIILDVRNHDIRRSHRAATVFNSNILHKLSCIK